MIPHSRPLRRSFLTGGNGVLRAFTIEPILIICCSQIFPESKIGGEIQSPHNAAHEEMRADVIAQQLGIRAALDVTAESDSEHP
jgi:hypothetical protein